MGVPYPCALIWLNLRDSLTRRSEVDLFRDDLVSEKP